MYVSLIGGDEGWMCWYDGI